MEIIKRVKLNGAEYDLYFFYSGSVIERDDDEPLTDRVELDDIVVYKADSDVAEEMDINHLRDLVDHFGKHNEAAIEAAEQSAFDQYTSDERNFMSFGEFYADQSDYLYGDY